MPRTKYPNKINLIPKPKDKKNEVPAMYQYIYCQALQELRAAIKEHGDVLTLFGFGRWQDMVGLLDVILENPDYLMYNKNLELYEFPDKYKTRYKEKQKKRKQKKKSN